MFSPTRMRHLEGIILAKDERSVLLGLGALGVLHLTPIPVTKKPVRGASPTLAHCDQVLSRGKEWAIPKAPASELSLADADSILKHMEIGFDDLIKRRQSALNRLNTAGEYCRKLAPFQELPIPPTGPEASAFLHVVAGSLPLDRMPVLRHGIGPNVVLFPLPADKDRQPLVALTTREGRHTLDATLKQAGFRHEPLATADFAAAERERSAAEADLDTVEVELRALRDKAAPPFAAARHSADTERRLSTASDGFLRTEATVLITGWVPATQSAVVEQAGVAWSSGAALRGSLNTPSQSY